MKKQNKFSCNRFLIKTIKANFLYLLLILFIPLCVSCKEDYPVILHDITATVKAEGGEFTLNVTSDAEIKPACPDWITLVNTTVNNQTQAFTFRVPIYYSKTGRKGEIYFHGGKQVRRAKISQDRIEAYTPSDDMSGFGDLNDKQIEVVDGWSKHGNNTGGLDEKTGKNIAMMWDGNKGKNESMCNTPWNAKYFGNVSGEALAQKMLALFPHELKFQLKEGAERLDYMMYYPRPNEGSGVFGLITEVLVSTYEAPDRFITVATNYDCGMTSQVRTIYFNKSIHNPHTVWVKVGSGKENFISCTEMEFFGKTTQEFDYSILFKDEMCTTLKDGISLEEIEKCPYPFFKNMALYMYYNCYESEFRIASFKAWEHPNKAANRNKTSTYSLLDNPTGIYVEKDEQLIALVGDMHDQSISLRVVNLDKPNGDGFDSYKEYTLKPGVNVHIMKDKGLVYVMYHTDAYLTAPPVKIHFASGKVNGYFDLYDEKHNKLEDWSNLLNNTSSLYFDVLGQYAHLTFPVTNLKSIIDPVGWIKFYDDLVYEEQKLLGLVKYNKMFKNRMYFSTMYTGYMYSTSYRTSYNANTLDGLCDLTQVKADPWGPAHEVGHSNQTSPCLKWIGMTEVTNNIQSMHIRRMTSGDSRLEIKGYYPHAMTTAFTGQPHITVGKIEAMGVADVFCQLVPFWQLQLYMANVLGNEDFYPDVFEAARLSNSANDNKKEAWEHQVEFAYTCSQKSKLDLTTFFEKWGFLREVNTTVVDYGRTGVFKIDAAKLKVIKNRIASLGLPKPQHNFWYITEKTEKIFKDNTPMNISGVTVRVDRGNKVITVNECKNAVAYEVYNKNTDKLIYVSTPGENILIDKTIAFPNKIEVRAIPASGEAEVIYSE